MLSSTCSSSQLSLAFRAALPSAQQRWASHLKKKRSTMDPEVAKMREARKRRNLERDILELLRHAKNLKPIDEATLPIGIQRRIEEYKRPAPEVPFEEAERRAILIKKWTTYQAWLGRKEERKLRELVASQERALNELKLVSPTLYQAALEPDFGLLGREVSGPRATPPLAGYASPDGDYAETTRSYDFQLKLDKNMQRAKWEERKKADILEERKSAKKKRKQA